MAHNKYPMLLTYGLHKVLDQDTDPDPIETGCGSKTLHKYRTIVEDGMF